jgi:hypothetical protein
MLTQEMALELAPYNIRCNSVSPVFGETPMGRASSPRESSPSTTDVEKIRAMVLQGIPSGQGRPTRGHRNAALFLASEEASLVTGINLIVDGGARLSRSRGLDPSQRGGKPMKKRTSETVVEMMYILDGGSIELDKSSMTFGARRGQKVRVPSPSISSRPAEAMCCVDTAGGAGRPAPRRHGPEAGHHPVPVASRLLEQAGLNRTRSIGDLSHLPWTTPEASSSLPKSGLTVQKDEHSYAFHPHAFSQQAYIQPAIDFPSYRWTLIDGDQVLCLA